ncbi:hypothetical protein CEB3_c27640 [Peptococcaceae bacterium CEB3]|nr:hypothetical protein CEB3_c27640 [Peptococcaceae bacterium CEB3]
MQKAMVSFYHCPVSVDRMEEELGSIEYCRIEPEWQQDMVLTSLVTNYFNLNVTLGEGISGKDTRAYWDRETGKLYGFITEPGEGKTRVAGIISKAVFQKMTETYCDRNIDKIIA